MPKAGCLPVVLAIVFVLVVSLLGGVIGRGLLGESSPLRFIGVGEPHVVLPPEAITHPLLTLGPLKFALTNSILAAWLTLLVLAVLSFLATRKMSLIPRGVQNLWETVVEKLFNFCIGVAGEKNGRRFFPVVATIFIFVVTNAWLSLIPGFGSITIVGAEGEPVPLLRGANTDLMVPVAIALISFFFVEYWGFSTLGVSYLSKFFNFHRLAKGKPMGIIDVIVGLLELLSEFIRIVSFSFRLFGNMTAGEILLLIAFFLVPLLGFLGYGLELLVGFIQALIFAALTLVFATLSVTPHQADGHE